MQRLHIKCILLLSLLQYSWSSYAQVDAVNDDYLIFENESQSATFADNDVWPSGQIPVFTITEEPSRGSIILQSNGSFTYSPPLNQFGYRDSVYYQICSNGICDIGFAEFVVVFHNNEPIAENDYFTVEMNASRTANVTANDGDPDSLTDPIDRSLDWIKFTNPTNGIVTNFGISGTFTYSPNNGFIGSDSFQYYAVDHCGLYDIATVYLTVVAVNLDPTANDQLINSLSEDVAYSGSLSQLAIDPENDPLTFQLVTAPNSGAITINANGTYTYTPSPNFTGNSSFTYQACDAVGQCDQGIVNLVVNNVDNDPPQLLNDNKIINEDTPTNVAVATNDTDDTAALSYSVFSQGAHGTVGLVSATGIFSYAPAANYSGLDSFVIQACDGVNCSTSIVYMQINEINDAPTALPFTITINEDNSTQGSFTSITDIEPGALVFTAPQGNSISGLSINSNGTYSYTPAANYFGTQSITIQGCDSQNLCATSTLTIQVNPVNDLPVVFNDNFSIQEDQVLQGALSIGETDTESPSLTYTVAAGTTTGSLALNPNGAFTYTPVTNWFGTESISISVCDGDGGCRTTQLTLTIASVNDSPIATAISLSTNEDVTLSGSLSAYASDVETATLNYSVSTNSANGIFTVSPNGNFTFVPTANYNGPSTFTYTACDNAGACASSAIAIAINPINDSPVFNDATISLNEDNLQSGTLTITDVDNSSFIISVTTTAQHGIFTASNNGQYSYQPNLNFFGTETITLTACDPSNLCDAAQITFTVLPVADNPDATDDDFVMEDGSTLQSTVSDNDTDGDNDVLQYTIITAPIHGQWAFNTNGSFSYISEPGYIGEENVVYQACDPSGRCDVATAHINILSGNSAPIASNSNFTLSEDQSTTNFLSNFITDAEGGVLFFSTITGPNHGSLVWNPNGSFTYAAQSNYNGGDSFTYRVCDSGNLCAEAQVFLTIAAINDAPQVENEILVTSEDNAFEFDLSQNDFEIEGELLAYATTSLAQHGVLSLSTLGILSYQPADNYFGVETITYSVCDASNNCTAAIMEITIEAVNDAPMVGMIALNASEDEILEGNLVNDVVNFENDQLLFSLGGNVSHGQAAMDANGNFSFSPEANYFGEASFDFEVCDAYGLCELASVTVNIEPLNDMPLLGDDNIGTQEDFLIAFNINGNDSDIENSSLTYSVITDVMFGAATLSSAGELTYLPFTNFFGEDQLTVQACDDQGACDSSIVYINVMPINDLPLVSNSSIQVQEDGVVSTDLINQTTDVESDILLFTSSDSSELGEFTLSENGEFYWQSAPNANGLDTLTFTVCDSDGGCTTGTIIMEVSAVNDAPVAQSFTISLSEDSATQGNFFDNATDVDGDSLQVSITQDVQHGTFIFDSTGHFVYAPTANFFGADSLVFAVCDNQSTCASGVIHFNVTFLNDLPIVSDEAMQIIVNNTMDGSVATNDIELDNEVLIYSIIEDYSGGSFVLNSDGSYNYTPASDTTGLFYVRYQACDPCNACDEGTITFFVVSQGEANTPPAASNYTGSVCQGGSATINLMGLISDAQDYASNLNLSFGTTNSGSYQLDPETQELIYQAPAFNSGDITIPYYVCDNGIISMCDTAYILLTIAPSSVIQITGFDIEHITCYGLNNGSISIDAIGEGTLAYNWSNGPTTSSQSELSAGTYTLTIASDQACAVAQSAQFTINTPTWIQSSFSVNDNDGNGTDNGDELSLSIEGGTAPYIITWQTPEGSLNGTAINIASNGNYTYVIQDANGCSATGSLAVNNTEELHFDLGVLVYPNPMMEDQELRISANEVISRISIYDMQGKVIYSANSNATNMRVDASSWASGVYTYSIIGVSQTHTGRIIKR